MINRALNILATMVLLMVAFLLISMSILVWKPVKVVDAIQPYKVVNPVVEAGDILRYEVEYCKYLDVAPNIVHQVIGDTSVRVSNGTISIELLDIGLRIQEGCGGIVKGIVIPPKLPSGVYYIEEHITYPVNILRIEKYLFKTEKFEVTQKNET